MVSKSYLKRLLKKVNDLRKVTTFEEVDKKDCTIVYLPIKSEEFNCYCEGLSSQHRRMRRNIKYTDKIRANCKRYLKIYKDKQGKVVFIEKFPADMGNLKLVFLARYENNVRYLFPFSEDGSFYPTYTFVAKFENNKVVEEYQVDDGQIVYEHYFNETKDKVDFYSINYVPEGSYPIRSECKGVYYFNPLRFEMLGYRTWLDDRKEDLEEIQNK